jgi:hypothetical protein
MIAETAEANSAIPLSRDLLMSAPRSPAILPLPFCGRLEYLIVTIRRFF